MSILLSAKQLRAYLIQAADGNIGHIKDFYMVMSLIGKRQDLRARLRSLRGTHTLEAIKRLMVIEVKSPLASKVKEL